MLAAAGVQSMAGDEAAHEQRCAENAVRHVAVPAQAAVRADRLESVATEASQRAKDANKHADNYMLCVVLFASSLFFAGLSTKLGTRTARIALLALGWVVFVVTVSWIATFPTQVTI